MKIFVIGNDKSILNENSKSVERIFEYSKIVDRYCAVIPGIKKIEFKKDNLEIYSFGGENKLFQIIKLFFGSIKILKNRASNASRSDAGREKFDVISVQDQYYLAFIAFLLSKKFKVGLEIQIHGFEKYSGFRKILANIVIPKASSIRVVSERLKREIIKNFRVNEETVTVVPIYTKVRTWDLGPRTEKHKFIFLTIGRLVKVKNIELQIRAMKNIVSKFKNIELHIVGDGPEKNYLENLVKDLELESYVKFFGYKENLDNFYINSDVFLLTSNYEGWGLVIIEALQYKLPIIMTDVGCANEIVINNENAIIIPVNDLNSLEQAMIKIYEDYNLREKFSNNSQITISKLLTKEQTLDLYKKSWEKAKRKLRLLILTQKVDKNDGVLGFFHRWIEEFAKHFEQVTVICLFKDECNVPNSVKILSLGKEHGESRLKYIFRFYKYIWKYRKDYDSVFVHMNQEYVLLGFFIWRILNKRFFLWRNHFYGNFLTDIACFLCNKTFCTSKFSYINKFKKNILMPVGIDTEHFKRIDSINKNDNYILFISRIAPNKKLDQLIEALHLLKIKNLNFHLLVVGASLPKHLDYYNSIKEKIDNYEMNNLVEFFGDIPNYKVVDFYNKCKLYINLSPSGCYDKTIFESMACESLLLTCNKNLINQISDNFIFEEDNVSELSEKLISVLEMSEQDTNKYGLELRNYVIENHSLKLLLDKLVKIL